MQEGTLAELLEWSATQPHWQRDALRRFFTAGSISPADLAELLKLAKAKHGLAEDTTGAPLEADHLAIGSGPTAPVSLMSVTHHAGVNALASEQTVSFGSSLTVVYGQNAAGKSGYTRILKQACRSRSREDVLGNVMVEGAPAKGRASLRFRVGAEERTVEWTSDGVPASALAAVSVFDAQCAPVYLRDKTDVAFRPFGLDVFDKLSVACGDLRKRLETEQKAISTQLPLPPVPAGSKVAGVLASLTALTDIDSLRALATLSPEETGRLEALRAQQRDVQSADPKKRAQELELKAARVDALVTHLAAIADKLGERGVERLHRAKLTLEAAQTALTELRKTALTPDLLTGTGKQAWRKLWESAGEFSQVAYPSQPFPATAPDAKCPLCQQSLGAEAAERFRHFQEFVTSSAQTNAQAAEKTLAQRADEIGKLEVQPHAMMLAVEELAAENAGLADQVRRFLAQGQDLQAALSRALAGRTDPLPGSAADFPETELRAAAQTLRDRAIQLRQKRPNMDPKEVRELAELEARVVLQNGLAQALGEVERLKRVAAYAQCIAETNTQAITRKSTELTTRLVTEQLKESFGSEIQKIEFTHLAVELRAAGGAKGTLYHQLVFRNAPGTPVASVLSEGEARALSLAAFLAELSTAPTASAIIFDDPVCSLDHIWRERIARRLVAETSARQVVVFTHDLVFLKCLLAEAERQKAACGRQYIRRDGAASGLCSEDLPWVAMGVKDRIGVLRNRWQAAEKTSRTTGAEAYEREAREIYGMLREAWEHAVGEVLLDDVIERYRPSIETQKVRHLHDISKQDCQDVEDAMTECSRWIRGHDPAPADGTPFPAPAELKKRIDDLDVWAKRIRQRR